MYNQLLFPAAADGKGGNDKNGPWLWSLNSVPALVKHWTWMHFIQPSEHSLKVDTVGVSSGDSEI